MTGLQLVAPTRRSLAPLALLALLTLGWPGGRAEAQPLQPGSEVLIYSWGHGRALRMTDGYRLDGSQLASASSLPASWTWERFLVVPFGASGDIALYSLAHQAFVRVGPSGVVDGEPREDMRYAPPHALRVVEVGGRKAFYAVAAKRFLAYGGVGSVGSIAAAEPSVPAGQDSRVTFTVRELRPPLASAPADLAAAAAAAQALPGFSAIADRLGAATADDNGYRLLRAPTMAVYAFKGAAWHASLELERPTTFTMPGVDQIGSVTFTTVAMVASSATEQLPLDRLPYGLRGALDGFATAGALPLSAGINVFIAGRPNDGGPLGQLKSALGLASEDVRITGTVGAGVFTRALHAADPSIPEAGAQDVAMTVTLPAMAPPLFRDLAAAARANFDLTVHRTTLTVRASAATPSTWSVTGAMAATARLAGQAFEASGALVVSGSGTSRTVTAELWADTATSLFGIDALRLQRVGARLSTSGTTSTIGLQARLAVNGGPAVTTSFAAVMNGTTLQEIRTSLVGTLPLGSLGLDARDVGSFSLANPTVGFMPATGEGFVGGRAAWTRPGEASPRLTVDAVVHARRAPSAGLAVFLKLTSAAKLSDVLGASAGAFDLPIPSGVLIASTVDFSTANGLPSAAQDMVAAIAGTSPPLSIRRGLALVTSIPASQLPRGFSGPVVIGGAIGFSPPSLALSASIATFTLPAEITSQIPLQSVAPKVFLRLSSAPALEVGVGMDLTFIDRLGGDRTVTMAGEMSGVLSSAGVSATLKGQLASDWVDPFGFTGLTIEQDTGLGFAGTADGSVAMTAWGAATIGAQTYGLGGSIGVRLSTVIPTPQSVALRLEASELSLLAPAQVGQVFLNNASKLVDRLRTAGGAALSGELRTALELWRTNVAGIDMPARLASVMPAVEPLQTMMTLELEDAVLFLATPGAATAGFPALDDIGVQVKGTLVQKARPTDAKDAAGDRVLASVDTYLTVKKGFQLRAMLADLAIGPLAITGASIDVGAGIPFVHRPAAAPRFRVSGAAALAGVELAHVDVDVGTHTIHADAGINLGPCRATVVATPKIGSLVALYSPHSRRFLRIEPSGALTAGPVGDGAPTSLPWNYTQQQFRVVDGGNGTLAFENEGTDRYLRMNDATMEAPALAALPASYIDQRFDVVLAGGGTIGLYNPRWKRFVRVNGGGGVDTSSPQPDPSLPADWAWERLQVVQLTRGADCSPVGVAGALGGDLTGVASFRVSGSARLTFPRVAMVQVPPLEGSFQLGTDGIAITEDVDFEGVRFRMTGTLTSLADWRVDGAAGANLAAKDFYLGQTRIATVTPDAGSGLSLHAAPDGSWVRARGGVAVSIPLLGNWAARAFHLGIDGELGGGDRAFELVLRDVPDPATAFATRKDVTIRIPLFKP